MALTVHEPASDRTLVSELHPDLEPLVDRAESLRTQLVGAGWLVVDVDFDEPD